MVGRGWKGELEFVLNRLVCSGRLLLREAQRAVATNWIAAAYLRYVGPCRPATLHTRAHGEDLSAPDRLVVRGRRALSLREREVAGLGPPSQGRPTERRRSRAGVLRPPPVLPHPKAAISASAAWRPTVAGPATSGNPMSRRSPVMWV